MGLASRVHAVCGVIRTETRRFVVGRSANVAMMFGLAAFPLFTGMGIALDVSRAMYVQAKLTAALDASALAVGGMSGASEADIEAAALRYFRANYPDSEIGVVSSLQVDVTEFTIRMRGTAVLDTTLLGVAGIQTIDVNGDVEVTRGNGALELALVLDTTGSMAEAGKMPALKAAASDMLDVLYQGVGRPERMRVSVVPFSQAVRLDTRSRESISWLDQTGQSSVARINFDSNRFAWSLYPDSGRGTGQLANSNRWNGCVEARPDGLEYLDTSPTSSDPDTYWVPYFTPDSPTDAGSASGFRDNYLDDNANGGRLPISQSNWRERWMRSAKYAGSNSRGPSTGCDMQPILALETNRGRIQSTINNLNPSGLTHIAIGLGWGWRTLTPNDPFDEALPFGTAGLTKALVVMTDGVNTIGANSSPLGSRYTAYGYLSQGRLGSTNYATALSNMNRDTAALCERIKAQGIVIYSILLMERDPATQSLMRGCASGENRYFDTPSPETLRTTFRAIATDLTNLRITR